MTTPELAGKALYLEMVANPDLSEDEQRRVTSWLGVNSVKQVIVFPPHTDDTGRTHAVRVMTRQVSDRSPRAQWDWADPTNAYSYRGVAPKPITPHTEVDSDEDYTFQYYSQEEWDTLPELAKQEAYKLALTNYLKQLTIMRVRDEDSVKAVEAWVVRNGKPISVETTTQDLEEVEAHKTPQAVIRRINKVRDSIPEFPKKLV